MFRAIILLALVAFSSAEKATFNNYKVFRVVPETPEQLNFLKQFDGNDGELSYWTEPTRVGRAADVMVGPSASEDFERALRASGSRHELLVEDVQKLIRREQPRTRTRQGGFGFDRYHTIDEIYAHLDELGRRYPEIVETVDAGKTNEGRVIKGVKLAFSNVSQPGVFVEGGIHAREWIAPATALYLVDQLLHSEQPDVRRLAETHDWYVFPSFNPDGYAYTHARNRLWRKTTSRTGFCMGADPNRNWGYKWMSGGASSNPCSEIYAGKKAFSEIEARTMAAYIKNVSDKLFAYISFHSYSQLLLIPYGHTDEHLDNFNETYPIGRKAMQALSKRYGTQYTTGTIAETIYIASGSSTDWVKANFKLPLVYTYELRDTGRNGFILPANQIIPNGEEVLDSLLVMFKEATKYGYPQRG